jgi:hypothetical protein
VRDYFGVLLPPPPPPPPASNSLIFKGLERFYIQPNVVCDIFIARKKCALFPFPFKKTIKGGSKMDKIVPIVAIMVSSLFADTLYLKNGQEIKDAVVTEIDDINVKYKIGEKQVIYTAKKSNIAAILYDDGTKDLFNSEPEERQVAEMPKLGKRYGIRIAYDNFISYGGEVINTERVPGSIYAGRSGNDEFGIGGFAVGWITNIPIVNTITLNSELNFIYRKALYGEASYIDASYTDIHDFRRYFYEDYNVTEFAISVPVLLQGMPFGGPIFYLEGGFQLDFPFLSKINCYDGNSVDYSDRAYLDFGIAVGFGWHIDEHFALGIRSVVGLTDFDKDGEGSLIQGGLGLSYLF